MRALFLLALLSGLSFTVYSQESKLQQKIGFLFAGIQLDSNQNNWRVYVSGSKDKFLPDSNYTGYGDMFQIVDLTNYQEKIPGIKEATLNISEVAFSMQQGQFHDTIDAIVVTIKLKENTSKEDAKKYFKNVRKICQSTFPFVRESAEKNSGLPFFFCNMKQFDAIPVITFCMIEIKDSVAYEFRLTYHQVQ